MTPAEVWPRPPSCRCGEWWDGWQSGYLQGNADGRAELAAEQLEAQQRMTARMEPAASVVEGLRAVRARKDARSNERRTAA